MLFYFFLMQRLLFQKDKYINDIAGRVVRGFKHGGTLNTDLLLSEIFRIKMTFKSCKEKQNLINVNCLLRTSDQRFSTKIASNFRASVILKEAVQCVYVCMSQCTDFIPPTIGHVHFQTLIYDSHQSLLDTLSCFDMTEIRCYY